MKKVVYNSQYGGFSISKQAADLMEAMGSPGIKLVLENEKAYGGNHNWGIHIDDYIHRHDPILVYAVESLGDKANGPSCKIRIEEIEDSQHYQIEEYDGKEDVKIFAHCDCCYNKKEKL